MRAVTANLFFFFIILLSPRAACAFDFTLQTSESQIALAPGAQAEVTVDIGNPMTMDSPVLNLRIGSWAGYDLALSPQGSCGSLQFQTVGGLTRASTQLPSVPAGTVRHCVLHATRHIETTENLNILLFLSELPPSDAGSASTVLEFGRFIDVSLIATVESSEVDAAGISHTIYRIGARNHSQFDIDPGDIILGDSCMIEPIAIEADMPGGCPLMENPCWFTGGPGKATMLPALSAGQSQSCLIRLSDRQSVNSSLDTQLRGLYRESSTGIAATDSDFSNNHLMLAVNAPSGTLPTSTNLPTLSTWALSLLGMILLVVASRAARQRLR